MVIIVVLSTRKNRPVVDFQRLCPASHLWSRTGVVKDEPLTLHSQAVQSSASVLASVLVSAPFLVMELILILILAFVWWLLLYFQPEKSTSGRFSASVPCVAFMKQNWCCEGWALDPSQPSCAKQCISISISISIGTILSNEIDSNINISICMVIIVVFSTRKIDQWSIFSVSALRLIYEAELVL